MNHINELEDYLIADEIHRIKSLSRTELVQELISVKALEIESRPVQLNIDKHGNSN